MWTPLQFLRNLARQQAHEELESILAGYKKSQREHLKREMEAVAQKWILVADSHAAGPIGQEVVLLEREFDYPVEIVGYIDAGMLAAGDTCGLQMCVQMYGKNTLTPLYSPTYDGPVEDFVALHPQIVVGKVKITHVQGAGSPKVIAYKFFVR